MSRNNYDQTHNAIMQAAIDLVSEHPNKFPGIREICDKVYINKSTFYYHFKSTEDLFRSIELA